MVVKKVVVFVVEKVVWVLLHLKVMMNKVGHPGAGTDQA